MIWVKEERIIMMRRIKGSLIEEMAIILDFDGQVEF